ncbi:MAG: tetratricopeptide repeat protein [Candidatus Kapabacteria bacterium]|nr:tetratricopeptide repeat protein [Candidatus Kapabacteria bacterium]
MAKSSRVKGSTSLLDAVVSSPWAYVSLILISAVIFGRSMSFTIDKFDEESILGPNITYLTTTATLTDVMKRDAFFRSPGQNFYRPIQNVTYYIDARLGRGKPPAFFVTNILLHAIASCLLFRLLSDVAGRSGVTFATAVFFALNPLFVHAICWIPGRGDLLLAVFSLGAALAADRYAANGSLRSLIITSICTLLAVFSKEAGVILVVLLPAYIIARRGTSAEVLRRSGLIAGISALLAAALIVLMRLVITKPPEWKSFDPFNLIDNIQVFPEIAAKLFVPTLLQPLAGYTVEATIIGAIVLVIMILTQIRSGMERSAMIALAGLAWYVLFMLPGAMYTHRFGSAAYDYLEHRGYASSIGLFMMLPGAFILLRRYIPKRMLLAGSFVALLGYAVLGYQHAGDYRNQMNFYDRAIETNPNSSMAWFNRGQTRQDLKDVSGAIQDYEEAIRRHPEFVAPYVIYGKTLSEQGLVDSAIAVLRRGNGIDASIPYCALLLGNAFVTKNMFDSAAIWYDRELQRFPDTYDAAINLGVSHAKTGRWQQSIAAFTRAASIDPSIAQAFTYRGLAYKEVGDLTNACQDWSKAAALGDAGARQSIDQFCR